MYGVMHKLCHTMLTLLTPPSQFPDPELKSTEDQKALRIFMETPKLGMASIENFAFIQRTTASSRSGSNIIKDCIRPAPSTSSYSLNKSDIPNGCHVEFWSFHVYQVPSNAQLTLVKIVLVNFFNVAWNWLTFNLYML